MKKILEVIFWVVLGVFVEYVILMAIITPDKDASGEIIPAETVLFGKK